MLSSKTGLSPYAARPLSPTSNATQSVRALEGGLAINAAPSGHRAQQDERKLGIRIAASGKRRSGRDSTLDSRTDHLTARHTIDPPNKSKSRDNDAPPPIPFKEVRTEKRDFRDDFPPPLAKPEEKERELFKEYNTVAKDYDENILDEWHETLNTFLLFATLLSAILAAFSLVSYTLLQQDNSDTTAEALVVISQQLSELINGSRNTFAYDTPDFSIPTAALWINALWFASLLISLAATISATLIMQWLRAYTYGLPDSQEEKGCERQRRFDALIRFNVPAYINLLPLLSHASVFLFLAGLVLFLGQRSFTLAITLCVGTALAFCLYVVALFMPLVSHDCPYRSPLTHLLASALRIDLDKQEAGPLHAFQPYASALLWLSKVSTSLSRDALLTLSTRIPWDKDWWNDHMQASAINYLLSTIEKQPSILSDATAHGDESQEKSKYLLELISIARFALSPPTLSDKALRRYESRLERLPRPESLLRGNLPVKSDGSVHDCQLLLTYVLLSIGNPSRFPGRSDQRRKWNPKADSIFARCVLLERVSYTDDHDEFNRLAHELLVFVANTKQVPVIALRYVFLSLPQWLHGSESQRMDHIGVTEDLGLAANSVLISLQDPSTCRRFEHVDKVQTCVLNCIVVNVESFTAVWKGHRQLVVL